MKLVLVCFFWLCAVIAQSQCTYSVSGRIATEASEWLSGATVELLPGPAVSSDEQGVFRFENLCAGSYLLRVRFIGYEPYEATILVPATTPLAVLLKVQRTMLDVVEVHDHFDHVAKTNNYQTLSGKELDETRGLSLGEALKKISGISTIQTGPAIFKPVIHGLHSQRILILNNGIRQEGQQWGAEHAPEIDPFMASNIIIIKDASAIKYGTDALGGLVVVNPADLPQQMEEIGGEFNLITQTNGRGATLSGLLEGGSKKLQGFGWRIQGTGRKVGDASAPDYTLSNTGFSELNFSAAAGLHKKEKGIDLFFSRFQTELGILKGSSISSTEDLRIAMEREPPQYTRAFTYAIENPKQKVAHNLLKLNAHLHKDYGDMKVQYGFQYNTRKEFDLRRQPLNSIPAMDLELITNTVDAEWQQHTHSRLTSNAGINTMIQINNNIPGTQRIPFIPDFTNYSGGLFYVGQLNLTPWLIDFGIRYDYRYYSVVGFDFANRPYTSSYTFGNPSVSFGATRSLGNHFVFKTNLASSWRPPHVSELYSFGVHQNVAAIEYGLLIDETTGQVLDFTDANVNHEKALKWVSTWQFHKGPIHTELTGYANYIFNYIYLKPSGITQTIRGVYPYFHYDQTNASFVGADFYGSANITSAFCLTAKASLLRAYDQSNNDVLIYIPPNRYELGVVWKKLIGNNQQALTLEAGTLYVDQQRRAPRVVTVNQILDAYAEQQDPFADDPRNFDFQPAPPAYFLFNLQAGTSLWLGTKTKADVFLRATNLLNTSYREYTNRMRYYADDVGRNISLLFKLSF